MRLTIVAVLGSVALVGCGGAGSGEPEQRAGLEEVHARIEGLSDCGELQREFDTAMDNAEARRPGDPARDASLAYADTADNRLREVDCY